MDYSGKATQCSSIYVCKFLVSMIVTVMVSSNYDVDFHTVVFLGEVQPRTSVNTPRLGDAWSSLDHHILCSEL